MAAKLKVAANAVAGELERKGNGENVANAEKCLNSAAKCQRVLSICLSKECTDKEMRRDARRSCRDVLRANMEASNCSRMCYARVLGKRTTTVVLEHGSTSMESLVNELNDGLRSKWAVCFDECRFQQGKDSPEYKSCVAKGYQDAVAKCAVEKCAKQSLSCVKEKC